MRRGTIFIILFLIIAAVVVGASQFLRSLPATEVTIAVSPLAERWVRAAAESFNATNPLVNSTQPIQIRIEVIDDPLVWQDGTRPWTAQSHPDGWLPALSASVNYAVEARLPIAQVQPTTARTLLVWGIFNSRATAAGANVAPLDWEQVQSVAATGRWDQLPGGQASWGFVKLVFGDPARSAGGLGVLVSGAAAHADDADVSANALLNSEFQAWMRPVLDSVPNFNTIGADPAAALTRGPSAGEIALLPESQWLTNLSGIANREAMTFSYPAYTLTFDFPLTQWTDTTTTDAERQGVRLFGDWLLSNAQQQAAFTYGLRPVELLVDTQATLFTAGVGAGIQINPPATQAITLPDRNTLLRLLSWVGSVR
ncbi:MAG: substrate-binding domain-containing protein [Chloroflexota bacterium]|nr:substrate-binding domain-containing protein [Chloroflexota bacterium]